MTRRNTMILGLLISLTMATAACGDANTIVGVQGVAANLTIVAAGPDEDPVVGGSVELAVGDTVALAATGTNAIGLAIGTVSVTWSSSDTAVVEVSSGGVVTAIAPGAAQITAEGEDADATLNVVVSDDS